MFHENKKRNHTQGEHQGLEQTAERGAEPEMTVLPPTPTEAGTGASRRPTGAPACLWGRPRWLWVCPQVGSLGLTPLHTATAASRTLPFYVEHRDCSPFHTFWGKIWKMGPLLPGR